jgi:hypothetical protein
MDLGGKMSAFNHLLSGHASKNTAAILGAFITTVALTICITLIWPFGDVIEQIFAGGTFFFIFWACLFYWALLAKDGKQAWLRILMVLIPTILIDVISLMNK